MDPDDFQNSVGTYHVQRYLSDKIFRKILSFFRRYEPNCGKMLCLTMLQKFFKKNPRFGPDTDVFQNLIRFSFPRDTSVIMELDVSSTNNDHFLLLRLSSLFRRLGERQFTNCILL